MRKLAFSLVSFALALFVSGCRAEEGIEARAVAQYTIEDMTDDDEGAYEVVVSNDCETESKTVDVDVRDVIDRVQHAVQNEPYLVRRVDGGQNVHILFSHVGA